MSKSATSGSKHISYGTEIIISGLMILGIFLLRTEIPFQVIILSAIQFLGKALNDAKQFLVSIFIDPVLRMEVSDLFGLFLIMYSSVLFIGQLRKRMVSSSYASNQCPVCSHKLHRIHRNRWQRFLILRPFKSQQTRILRARWIHGSLGLTSR
ncbi:MAG: hypothetical protein HQ507_03520 [Candidatus Marinimicrobia bacterium]|nr:hypothetical protein [Candidatus Neomarinimicrobiota bacterium]